MTDKQLQYGLSVLIRLAETSVPETSLGAGIGGVAPVGRGGPGVAGHLPLFLGRGGAAPVGRGGQGVPVQVSSVAQAPSGAGG